VDKCISDNKGDQLAILYREKRYSYNDVAALMNRAGNMFKRFNVGTGDQILVAVSPSPSLVASVLGAMKIGATAVVVTKKISSQFLSKLTADGRPKLLIVDAARLPEFETAKAGIKRLVVGEAGDGQQSFLQEMRASASSLKGPSESGNAPALGVTDADDLVWLTHDQITRAKNGLDGNTPFGKSVIGKALVQLARGEEVVIS
jgi:acyl-coenzyme A synthetase/AMP-(fatty) acid ligase